MGRRASLVLQRSVHCAAMFVRRCAAQAVACVRAQHAGLAGRRACRARGVAVCASSTYGRIALPAMRQARAIHTRPCCGDASTGAGEYRPPWSTDHMERTATSPRRDVRCGGHVAPASDAVTERRGVLTGQYAFPLVQVTAPATLVQLQSVSPTVRHVILRVDDPDFTFAPGQVGVRPRARCMAGVAARVYTGTVSAAIPATAEPWP